MAHIVLTSWPLTDLTMQRPSPPISGRASSEPSESPTDVDSSNKHRITTRADSRQVPHESRRIATRLSGQLHHVLKVPRSACLGAELVVRGIHFVLPSATGRRQPGRGGPRRNPGHTAVGCPPRFLAHKAGGVEAPLRWPRSGWGGPAQLYPGTARSRTATSAPMFSVEPGPSGLVGGHDQ